MLHCSRDCLHSKNFDPHGRRQRKRLDQVQQFIICPPCRRSGDGGRHVIIIFPTCHLLKSLPPQLFNFLELVAQNFQVRKMAPRPRPRSSTPIASVTPVIAFLDVDSFECQIWQREDPSKLGKPCVVANRSGLILAATYEAKAFGISRSLTPTVKTAKELCPHLHVFWKPNRWGKQDQSKLRMTTAEIVHHILVNFAFLVENVCTTDISVKFHVFLHIYRIS